MRLREISPVLRSCRYQQKQQHQRHDHDEKRAEAKEYCHRAPSQYPTIAELIEQANYKELPSLYRAPERRKA